LNNVKNLYLFKVLIAGDGGVGKSTLLKRLVDNVYYPQEITIGLGYEVFKTEINGDEVRLLIWDLGGQKQFRPIHELYCKGAKGIILTYDLSRKPTFINLHFWNQFIKEELVGSKNNIVKTLIGTKMDLGNFIPDPMIEDFKKENNIKYHFFTSAKTNMNVLSCFRKIAELLYNRFVKDNLERDSLSLW
jgi:small GTP-binding protein